MAVTINDTSKKVWNYLIKAGMTKAGAAGMMGNIFSESGMIPNRVEILCLQRLREAGKVYTDATYTAFVDDGTITRAGFLNPLPGKQYGYGLCQWTTPSRKAGLYDLCKKKKVSIGDLDAQLEWLITELKTSYKTVWNTLKKTASIQTASNAVLTRFECPADTGSGVKSVRYNYSKQYYDAYSSAATATETSTTAAAKTTTAATAKASGMTEAQAIQRVIDIAAAEEGYLEKASNAYLDDKTANAGYNNYTKYWRDLYPPFQAQYWCAIFVAWCFYKAFGLEAAKKLLKHWPYTYCPTLASMTTNKTPKVGSVILFWNGGTYSHTGLVIEVSSFRITTIEGNTTGASGIISNGGGVCRKVYNRSALSPYTKYFMPDYSIVTGQPAAAAEAAKVEAAKSDTKTSLSDVPYMVKVPIPDLNIRTGPGTNYPTIGRYTGIGVFTIMEVRSGIGSDAGWGRLKSGLGWIALDYATKIVK